MQMRESTGTAVPKKLDESSPTERVQIVAPASWLERLDEWRRRQPKIPNRSEAIRRLVDIALDAQKTARRRPDPR